MGRDETMNEEDINNFLEDFKKGEIQQKMDMWFFALEQEAIWEDIMDEMSKIARIQLTKQGVKPSA